MERFISGIEELNLGEKVAGGNCSDIYVLQSGIYFKKFNEDYRDLLESINAEFYETIRALSEIGNIPSIVKAIDIYRSVLELYGYSMPAIDADELCAVSDDTLVLDVVDSFDGLKPQIRTLSNNYVKTEDIGGDNILYNGSLYLLDLDLSLIDRGYIPDELYSKTCYSVFKALQKRMVGRVYDSDGFASERASFKNGNSDNYAYYFRCLLDRCSDGVNESVRTLGDFKKAYQKIRY